MTRQEILNTPEIVDFMIDKSVMVDSKIKLHKRLEELCKLAIKALEQESVLDKISAEIDQKQYYFMDDKDYDEGIRFGLTLAYQTVDKYKTESEGEE